MSSTSIGKALGRLIGHVVLLPRYGISHSTLATRFIVDDLFRSTVRFCDNHRQHYATKDLRSPQNLFPLTKPKVAPARLKGGPTTRLTCLLRSISRSDDIEEAIAWSMEIDSASEGPQLKLVSRDWGLVNLEGDDGEEVKPMDFKRYFWGIPQGYVSRRWWRYFAS